VDDGYAIYSVIREKVLHLFVRYVKLVGATKNGGMAPLVDLFGCVL